MPAQAGKQSFPPVFSSPAAPGWDKGRFGFFPGLRTPQLPADGEDHSPTARSFPIIIETPLPNPNENIAWDGACAGPIRYECQITMTSDQTAGVTFQG